MIFVIWGHAFILAILLYRFSYENKPSLSGLTRQSRNNMRTGYVYILATKKNGTIYVGVTSDLVKRVYWHKNKLLKGFSSKYGVCRLVYFEKVDDTKVAIQREKNIKRYRRKWKLDLIEKDNFYWRDLYGDIAWMESWIIGSSPIMTVISVEWSDYWILGSGSIMTVLSRFVFVSWECFRRGWRDP